MLFNFRKAMGTMQSIKTSKFGELFMASVIKTSFFRHHNFIKLKKSKANSWQSSMPSQKILNKL